MLAELVALWIYPSILLLHAGPGESPFALLGRIAKAHARVVWTCSWAPDGRAFATGARDATVKIWAAPRRRPRHASLLFACCVLLSRLCHV